MFTGPVTALCRVELPHPGSKVNNSPLPSILLVGMGSNVHLIPTALSDSCSTRITTKTIKAKKNDQAEADFFDFQKEYEDGRGEENGNQHNNGNDPSCHRSFSPLSLGWGSDSILTTLPTCGHHIQVISTLLVEIKKETEKQRNKKATLEEDDEEEEEEEKRKQQHHQKSSSDDVFLLVLAIGAQNGVYISCWAVMAEGEEDDDTCHDVESPSTTTTQQTTTGRENSRQKEKAGVLFLKCVVAPKLLHLCSQRVLDLALSQHFLDEHQEKKSETKKEMTKCFSTEKNSSSSLFSDIIPLEISVTQSNTETLTWCFTLQIGELGNWRIRKGPKEATGNVLCRISEGEGERRLDSDFQRRGEEDLTSFFSSSSSSKEGSPLKIEKCPIVKYQHSITYCMKMFHDMDDDGFVFPAWGEDGWVRRRDFHQRRHSVLGTVMGDIVYWMTNSFTSPVREEEGNKMRPHTTEDADEGGGQRMKCKKNNIDDDDDGTITSSQKKEVGVLLRSTTSVIPSAHQGVVFCVSLLTLPSQRRRRCDTDDASALEENCCQEERRNCHDGLVFIASGSDDRTTAVWQKLIIEKEECSADVELLGKNERKENPQNNMAAQASSRTTWRLLSRQTNVYRTRVWAVDLVFAKKEKKLLIVSGTEDGKVFVFDAADAPGCLDFDSSPTTSEKHAKNNFSASTLLWEFSAFSSPHGCWCLKAITTSSHSENSTTFLHIAAGGFDGTVRQFQLNVDQLSSALRTRVVQEKEKKGKGGTDQSSTVSPNNTIIRHPLTAAGGNEDCTTTGEKLKRGVKQRCLHVTSMPMSTQDGCPRVLIYAMVDEHGVLTCSLFPSPSAENIEEDGISSTTSRSSSSSSWSSLAEEKISLLKDEDGRNAPHPCKATILSSLLLLSAVKHKDIEEEEQLLEMKERPEEGRGEKKKAQQYHSCCAFSSLLILSIVFTKGHVIFAQLRVTSSSASHWQCHLSLLQFHHGHPESNAPPTFITQPLTFHSSSSTLGNNNIVKVCMKLVEARESCCADQKNEKGAKEEKENSLAPAGQKNSFSTFSSSSSLRFYFLAASSSGKLCLLLFFTSHGDELLLEEKRMGEEAVRRMEWIVQKVHLRASPASLASSGENVNLFRVAAGGKETVSQHHLLPSAIFSQLRIIIMKRRNNISPADPVSSSSSSHKKSGGISSSTISPPSSSYGLLQFYVAVGMQHTKCVYLTCYSICPESTETEEGMTQRKMSGGGKFCPPSTSSSHLFVAKAVASKLFQLHSSVGWDRVVHFIVNNNEPKQDGEEGAVGGFFVSGYTTIGVRYDFSLSGMLLKTTVANRCHHEQKKCTITQTVPSSLACSTTAKVSPRETCPEGESSTGGNILSSSNVPFVERVSTTIPLIHPVPFCVEFGSLLHVHVHYLIALTANVIQVFCRHTGILLAEVQRLHLQRMYDLEMMESFFFRRSTISSSLHPPVLVIVYSLNGGETISQGIFPLAITSTSKSDELKQIIVRTTTTSKNDDRKNNNTLCNNTEDDVRPHNNTTRRRSSTVADQRIGFSPRGPKVSEIWGAPFHGRDALCVKFLPQTSNKEHPSLLALSLFVGAEDTHVSTYKANFRLGEKNDVRRIQKKKCNDGFSSLQRIGTYAAHRSNVISMSFLPGTSFLISIGSLSTVCLWKCSRQSRDNNAHSYQKVDEDGGGGVDKLMLCALVDNNTTVADNADDDDDEASSEEMFAQRRKQKVKRKRTAEVVGEIAQVEEDIHQHDQCPCSSSSSCHTQSTTLNIPKKKPLLLSPSKIVPAGQHFSSSYYSFAVPRFLSIIPIDATSFITGSSSGELKLWHVVDTNKGNNRNQSTTDAKRDDACCSSNSSYKLCVVHQTSLPAQSPCFSLALFYPRLLSLNNENLSKKKISSGKSPKNSQKEIFNGDGDHPEEGNNKETKKTTMVENPPMPATEEQQEIVFSEMEMETALLFIGNGQGDILYWRINSKKLKNKQQRRRRENAKKEPEEGNTKISLEGIPENVVINHDQDQEEVKRLYHFDKDKSAVNALCALPSSSSSWKSDNISACDHDRQSNSDPTTSSRLHYLLVGQDSGYISLLLLAFHQRGETRTNIAKTEELKKKVSPTTSFFNSTISPSASQGCEVSVIGVQRIFQCATTVRCLHSVVSGDSSGNKKIIIDEKNQVRERNEEKDDEYHCCWVYALEEGSKLHQFCIRHKHQSKGVEKVIHSNSSPVIVGSSIATSSKHYHHHHVVMADVRLVFSTNTFLLDVSCCSDFDILSTPIMDYYRNDGGATDVGGRNTEDRTAYEEEDIVAVVGQGMQILTCSRRGGNTPAIMFTE